jgi:hypothetical protein
VDRDKNLVLVFIFNTQKFSFQSLQAAPYQAKISTNAIIDMYDPVTRI